MESRFCYEIQAEAGIAYDAVTGKNAKAYTEVRLQHEQPISEEAYKIAHEEQILFTVASETGIKPEHLKPISTKQFDQEHGECEHCREH